VKTVFYAVFLAVFRKISLTLPSFRTRKTGKIMKGGKVRFMLISRRETNKLGAMRWSAGNGWSVRRVVLQRLGINGGGIRISTNQANYFVGLLKHQSHDTPTTDRCKPRLGHSPLQAGGTVVCGVSPAA
jgi:hypothetical protein